MKLSDKFSIDSSEPWVRKHNKEAHAVCEAYKKDTPIRVPLFANDWFGAHGFYVEESGADYIEYYSELSH